MPTDEIVEARRKSRHILDLPEDILFLIFRYCDAQTLCRLCRVCRLLNSLASQDYIWLMYQTKFGALRIGNEKKLPAKDKCRIARNRNNKIFWEYPLLVYKSRQLPWIDYRNEELWVSDMWNIRNFQQHKNGKLRETNKSLRGLREDVTKFVVKHNKVVSGCRGGGVHVWDSCTGCTVTHLKHIHQSDTHVVDVFHDIVVSGSRDHTVKVTSISERKTKCTFGLGDRVWSLSINPTGSSFACGTAFCFSRAPIVMFDLEREKAMSFMGDDLRLGSGVLDMKFESPHILLSCGYDTCIRLWDTRTCKCVGSWEDPFDNAVNCVQSDDEFTMFAGTARHGIVRVWDKRKSQPVQLFYTGRKNSPVYSLAFNHEKLFCAFDLGIQVLDFNVQKTSYYYGK